MAEYNTIGTRGTWRSEELKGLKPTVYDWARLAAFIDGEGSVQINPYSNRAKGSIFQARVLITNTNPILPLWLTETFGGNVVTRDHKNPKWKVAYIWSCTAGRASWILHNCMPWFLLKKAQAELLLEMQDRIDKTTHGRGRTISDAERDYRSLIHEKVKSLNHKGPE